MTDPVVELTPTLIEVPGKPLGRHRLTNWRDVARHLPEPVPEEPLVSTAWRPNVATALDQIGGSCTGNATAQCASTQPYPLELTETEAMALYSRATQLDPFAGSYPPDDTGSTGWAAMRAAVEAMYFDGLAMANTLTALARALQTRPGIVGVDWYEGLDDPDETGRVRPTGRIRGGHEVEVLELDVEQRRVWFRNSWGDGYGVEHLGAGGCFWMSFGDLALLLESGGDATFPDAP